MEHEERGNIPPGHKLPLRRLRFRGKVYYLDIANLDTTLSTEFIFYI